MGSVILLASTGCIEVDGLPIEQEEQASSPACPAGTPKRRAVPLDLLDVFPSCCHGAGHLLPDFLIPKDFRDRLAPGPQGTLCVPDEFATDSEYTPNRCTSLFGLKGACLSSCLPQVQNAAVKLPQSECAQGQLCAPCIDPQTKQPSGACDFGLMACDPPEVFDDCKPHEPTLDLSTYEPCCTNGPAHCAPADLVPEGQRKDLTQCTDGQSYCVPDEILRRGGKHQPPRCQSMGGREGRCLSLCVKSLAEQEQNEPGTLPQSSCEPHQRCVPCYDPRTGMGTGACTVGPCDKPDEGPKTFEECGASSGDALCIPADLVPASERSLFDNRGCQSGCDEPNTLCLPKKVIDAGETFAPRQCEASLSGFLALFMTLFSNPFEAFQKMDEYSEGRCLSKCIPQVRDNPSAGMLSSKGCDAEELCIPCYDPQKVKEGLVPTGACHHGSS